MSAQLFNLPAGATIDLLPALPLDELHGLAFVQLLRANTLRIILPDGTRIYVEAVGEADVYYFPPRTKWPRSG